MTTTLGMDPYLGWKIVKDPILYDGDVWVSTATESVLIGTHTPETTQVRTLNRRNQWLTTCQRMSRSASGSRRRSSALTTNSRNWTPARSARDSLSLLARPMETPRD